MSLSHGQPVSGAVCLAVDSAAAVAPHRGGGLSPSPPEPVPPPAATRETALSTAIEAPAVAAARITSAEASAVPRVCERCGGSGKLRLGDQRYRTCLDCLGGGQQILVAASPLWAPRFSAGASASGAR